jgi:D-tyrosyl-tRNA(Tyr) deacylase
MRAIIQRTTKARVTVENRKIADISLGLVILLGVGPEDTAQRCRQLADKISHLRIFGDADGKMNLSVLDVHGEAIVVSQFTLYADTHKGHRPSFLEAAPPEIARPLCDQFIADLRALGVPTQMGEFGAHMQVELVNDGPVTIQLEL